MKTELELTVTDGLFRNAGSVLTVPAFIQLDTAFAVRRTVDAEHTEIAHMDAQLFDGSAPLRTAR